MRGGVGKDFVDEAGSLSVFEFGVLQEAADDETAHGVGHQMHGEGLALGHGGVLVEVVDQGFEVMGGLEDGWGCGVCVV